MNESKASQPRVRRLVFCTRHLMFGVPMLMSSVVAAAPGCSATAPTDRPPASQRLPRGIATPLASPQAASAASPRAASAASAANKSLSTLSNPFPPADYTRDLSSQLDLRQFAPLLDLPALASLKKLFQAKKFGACADALEAWLRRNPPAVLEEPRYYLLLGNLRTRDKDPRRAHLAYRRSGDISWPLQDYALLGLGRSLVALDKPDAAYRALDKISSGSTFPSAQGILADISCPRGATEQCVKQLDVYTTAGIRPKGWARGGFRLMAELTTALTRNKNVSTQSNNSESRTSQLRKALAFLRTLMTRAPNTASSTGAGSVEQQLLIALPKDNQRQLRARSVEQRLVRLRALANAGRRGDTEAAAKTLLGQLGSKSYGAVGCEARYLWGKALSSRSHRARGVTQLKKVIEHCTDPDRRAWSLYLAGKFSFRLNRYSDADHYFTQLELEAPDHRLADDARLYRAKAQQEMGVNGRFSELLGSMADDYPQGDMVRDGVFALALHSMQRGDWSGAETTLRKLANQEATYDLSRGPEWAGRERYFHARSLVRTGEVKRGLMAYESLIHDLPLSYYMLHAYTRLRNSSPERAERVLQREISAGRRQPFEIQARPEFEDTGFIRFIELMRQGQLDAARTEVKLLSLGRSPDASPLLWGVAELWAQAGSPQFSHSIPRWRLHDWQQHWPSGQWQRAWQLAFPRPFRDEVSREAKSQSIEPQLVYAVMREESAFNAAAVSGANAYGLMQVVPPTARQVGKAAGLPYDKGSLVKPEVSIALGSRVLSSYRARFPLDPLLAIPGYNAGVSRPKRWLREFEGADFDLWVELIPYRETRRYTKRVLASRAAYAYLYYPSETDKSPGDSLTLPLRVHPPDK